MSGSSPVSLGALGLILGSVSVTAFAQLALKLASMRHAGELAPGSLWPSLWEQLLNPWTLVGMIGYGASFVLWVLALREVPLTIAYPFMGLTLVLVSVLGVLVLGESLGSTKLFGMLLICAGLVLIARG